MVHACSLQQDVFPVEDASLPGGNGKGPYPEGYAVLVGKGTVCRNPDPCLIQAGRTGHPQFRIGDIDFLVDLRYAVSWQGGIR